MLGGIIIYPLLTITLYARKNDPASLEAKVNLEALQEKYPHRLVEVDVDSDPVIQKNFGDNVPSIEVGPYKLNYPFDKQKLTMTVGAAYDRRDQLDKPGREDHMETQSVSKAKKLANASQTRGLRSIGILIIPILFLLLFRDNVVLGCLFTLLLFGSALLGLLACSGALVAIWMNWRGGNDPAINRTATIGLILGGIPVVIVVVIYYVAWLSVSQSL